MVYKIVWTERASDDLRAIVRYISRRNPTAAESMGYGIYDCVQILAEFPESGSMLRELRDPDWRHLIFRNFRIVHHLNREAKTVEIVRIWHGARGDIDVSS
jgi:plasmid stabilization system protein ParE